MNITLTKGEERALKSLVLWELKHIEDVKNTGERQDGSWNRAIYSLSRKIGIKEA